MRTITLSQGKVAIVDDQDYRRVVADGKWSLARRGALLYAFGRNRYLHRFLMRPPPGFIVDHVNGDGLDCRRRNMRLATKSSNGAHRITMRRRRSRYHGVYFANGYWMARISTGGAHALGKRRVFAKACKTQKAAALAYNDLAVKHFGEFATLNRVLP